MVLLNVNHEAIFFIQAAKSSDNLKRDEYITEAVLTQAITTNVAEMSTDTTNVAEMSTEVLIRRE